MATTNPTSKTWLITGASQGLGLSLTLAALRAGHKVLATARNPEKARSQYPEVEKEGGIWVELDVSKADTQVKVDAAIREQGDGRIDVMVNNAGYNLFKTVEDMLDEEMMLSLETHIMGPFRIIKAVLPYMRAQKSGTLVFHSSCLGMRPCPGQGAYSAPKAAGDMLHEVLRLELRTFGIRTLIVNSGLFQTGILTNAPPPKGNMGQHYFGEGTALAGCMPHLMKAQSGPNMMRGDPKKWGERVVQVVDGSGEYGGSLKDVTRVLLGGDSVMLGDQQIERLKREIDGSREIGGSTDLDGTDAEGMAYLAEVDP